MKRCTALAVLFGLGLIAALPGLAARSTGKAQKAGQTSGNRIVTLAPHLAELVCAAGGCGEIRAVSAYTTYPHSLDHTEVVGDERFVSVERLLGLKPTAIYAWDGGTPDWQLAKLRQLGLPLRLVRIDDLEGVASTLEQLGRELGHPGTAADAARQFRDHIAALRQKYAGARKLKVFYQIESSPAYTVNRQSPISEVITLCGGVNVFAQLDTLAAPVSAEAILAARPDVVLHSDSDGRAIRDYWQRFSDLPVAQLRNIYGVDPELLTRAGPRLAQGADAVCEALDLARSVIPE